MKQERDLGYCQCCYADLTSATLPDPRRALRLRRLWWTLKRYAWYARVLGLYEFVRRISDKKGGHQRSSSEVRAEDGDLNLKPGELVEVRSEKEIFGTLDSQGKLRGLRFTPEMSKYCGKRFRVYKRVQKIIVEATGEKRSMQGPTVLLEGVICDGSGHEGCDRSCFPFWRERWLKRVSIPSSEESLR
jgi:hypothetical protein